MSKLLRSKGLKWSLVLLTVVSIGFVNLKCEASLQTGALTYKPEVELSSKETEKEKTLKRDASSSNKTITENETFEFVPSPLSYQVIYNHVLKTSPSLGHDRADGISRAILAGCSKYQVDPFLATALFTQESGFHMSAISRTGAIGIAQLQPETARSLGVNPYDMSQNIDGGIHYLADQLRTFGGSGAWANSYAIAAYNAGPGAVKKYGGIPPYEETINHVYSVGAILNRLMSHGGGSPDSKMGEFELEWRVSTM